MGKRRRILIIDDNEHIVAALKVFLDRKYEIFTACNGAEGLAEMDRSEDGMDLVITDLVMPELSGVELISTVKKRYPKTPIIAMTGWGSTRPHWHRKRMPTGCWSSRSGWNPSTAM